MPHDFCMHTCTQKCAHMHAHTHTHASNSTEPNARSKGGLRSGITYLSTARDPRGHSHLGLVQVRWLEKKAQLPLPHRCVCARACPMHLLHTRLIPGTPGGVSLLTSHSSYYWLTFSGT